MYGKKRTSVSSKVRLPLTSELSRLTVLGAQVASPLQVSFHHEDMHKKDSQLVTLSPPLEVLAKVGHESDGPRELPMALTEPVEFTLTTVP